jgi:hypothetical protein
MRAAAKVFVAFVVLVALWRSWALPPPERLRRDEPSHLPAPGPVIPSHAHNALVEMPMLIGVDDSFAKHVLELAHLRTGTIRLESSTRPWGSVIGQSIAPGASVPREASVDLVLAKGSVPEPCRLYWCSTGTAGSNADEQVSSRGHGAVHSRELSD